MISVGGSKEKLPPPPPPPPILRRVERAGAEPARNSMTGDRERGREGRRG